MRGGRIAIAALLAVLFGGTGAASALACSCAPATPRESLAAADAAIVGRLLTVAPHGPGRAEYRYRVVRVYRGGDRIGKGTVLTVLSGRGSAGCALPTRTARNYGLFLLGQGGRWASGICGVLTPRRLWRAAQGASEGGAAATGAGISCAS
ncbi:MAG TPA: hypothetical protein VHA54_02530 [Solirubrobacterales bacterium]|nr:hypothetical protein [Solirubrobacterales bacterium]